MASEHLNVRITGNLRGYIASQISPDGLYENASEYIRDLVRRDYERQQQQWQPLYQELKAGFYADDNEFVAVSAQDVINRNT